MSQDQGRGTWSLQLGTGGRGAGKLSGLPCSLSVQGSNSLDWQPSSDLFPVSKQFH